MEHRVGFEPTALLVCCQLHWASLPSVHCLVEDKGIEPLTEACKATVFPLAPIPLKWSEYKDSNLGPSAPKADALPDCAILRKTW